MIELPSKHAISKAFGRKASKYNTHALIQTVLLETLCAKILRHIPLKGKWLDAGCGTGLLWEKFRSIKAGCGEQIGDPLRYFGMDISAEPLLLMSVKKPGPVFQGDIEILPVKRNAFDLAVIASVLQWSMNTSSIFYSLRKVLKPDGLLAYSIFIEGSFRELHETRIEAGLTVPVHLENARTYIQCMNDAGFKISKNDSYEFVDYKKSASEVLYNIASFGGTATAGKLMNRTELRKFCDLYESKHRTSKGIPLTYKAIQGIAYCSGPGKHND